MPLYVVHGASRPPIHMDEECVPRPARDGLFTPMVTAAECARNPMAAVAHATEMECLQARLRQERAETLARRLWRDIHQLERGAR